MGVDISRLSHLSISTGILYFCKFLLLALLLWFVYYVSKIILSSLREASVRGRLNLHDQREEHHSQQNIIGVAVGESSEVVAGGESGSRDISIDCTISSKARPRGLRWTESAVAIVSEEDVPRVSESSEEETCASLGAVINTSGFVEIVSGVDTKLKRLPIEKRAITFGRARDCTIRVRDGYTSSRHAKVFADKDGVYLEDIGSRNGTFLNNTRIDDPILLEDGDTFTIGDAVFRYTRF